MRLLRSPIRGKKIHLQSSVPTTYETPSIFMNPSMSTRAPGTVSKTILKRADELLNLNTFFFDLDGYEKRLSNSEIVELSEIKKKFKQIRAMMNTPIASLLSKKINWLHRLRYSKHDLIRQKLEAKPVYETQQGSYLFMDDDIEFFYLFTSSEAKYLSLHFLQMRTSYHTAMDAFNKQLSESDPNYPLLLDKTILQLPSSGAFKLEAKPFVNTASYLDENEFQSILDSETLLSYFLTFRDEFSFELSKYLKRKNLSMENLEQVSISNRKNFAAISLKIENARVTVVQDLQTLKLYQHFFVDEFDFFNILESDQGLKVIYKPKAAPEVSEIRLDQRLFVEVSKKKVTSVSEYMESEPSALANFSDSLVKLGKGLTEVDAEFSASFSVQSSSHTCLAFKSATESELLFCDAQGDFKQLRIQSALSKENVALFGEHFYFLKDRRLVKVDLNTLKQTETDYFADKIRAYDGLLSLISLDNKKLKIVVLDSEGRKSEVSIDDGEILDFSIQIQETSSNYILLLTTVHHLGAKKLRIVDLVQLSVKTQLLNGNGTEEIVQETFEETSFLYSNSGGFRSAVVNVSSESIDALPDKFRTLISLKHALINVTPEAFDVLKIQKLAQSRFSKKITIITRSLVVARKVLECSTFDGNLIVEDPENSEGLQELFEEVDFSQVSPLFKVMFSGFEQSPVLMKLRKVVAKMRAEEMFLGEVFFTEISRQNPRLLDLNTVEFAQSVGLNFEIPNAPRKN